MRVFFEQVGREKKAWTLETDSLSDRVLVASIRSAGALMSQMIGIYWRSPTEARIGVGPLGRAVGTLRVEGGARLDV